LPTVDGSANPRRANSRILHLRDTAGKNVHLFAVSDSISSPIVPAIRPLAVAATDNERRVGAVVRLGRGGLDRLSIVDRVGHPQAAGRIARPTTYFGATAAVAHWVLHISWNISSAETDV